MKKVNSKEFKIGLSVIIALAILFFGIDYLKGINLFKPANFYIASYDNVAGLEIAAPVSIDGYKVGQVREINFDYNKPGKIDVLLALNKELMIPEDSKAIIGTGLLSGASINIVLGKSKKMIPVGGNIQTYAAPDMMASVSDNIIPTVQTILPKVDSLMTNVNNLLTNQSMLMALGRLDGISQNVLYATDGLNRTLNADLPVIMNRTGNIVYNLDTLSAGLGKITNQLRGLPIQQTMANVEMTTENLRRFSEQLNDPNSTLGLLMNDPELYHRLNRISADVDSLIVDIERNPKRYISIKLF